MGIPYIALYLKLFTNNLWYLKDSLAKCKFLVHLFTLLKMLLHRCLAFWEIWCQSHSLPFVIWSLCLDALRLFHLLSLVFFLNYIFLGGHTHHIWWVRGQIRAVAASAHHSLGNPGSKPHLRPTPQLTATPDP